MRPSSLVTLLILITFGSGHAASGGAFLGAQLAPLTPDAIKRLGVTLSNGALITGTFAGSPAAQAGLKSDDVVVSADGQSVASPDDLAQIVGRHAPGETVSLQIVDVSHGFNSRNVTIKLTAPPADVQTSGAPAQSQQGAQAGANSADDEIYSGFDDFDSGSDVQLDDDTYDDSDDYDSGGTDAQAGKKNQTGPHAVPPAPEGSGVSSSQTPSTQSRGAPRNPIPVHLLQGQFCRALAPDGWMIVDQDAQGSTLTLASTDGRTKAAYGVMPVNGGAAAGYYGAQMQTPAGVAQYTASLVAGGELRVLSVQDFMGAQVETFQGPGENGFVLYRAYPVPADPYGGYVLSMRIAMGPSPQEAGIAGAVASTINCTTQFHAPAGGYAQVQPKSAEKATGTSAKCQAGSCDDGDLAGTYNVQLGTGYVHSDSGQNFIVDPSTDYLQTGPDGPGYYVTVGNSLQKAEPGWSD